MTYHRPASRWALAMAMSANILLSALVALLYASRPSDQVWFAQCHLSGLAVVEVLNLPGTVRAPISVAVHR